MKDKSRTVRYVIERLFAAFSTRGRGAIIENNGCWTIGSGQTPVYQVEQ